MATVCIWSGYGDPKQYFDIKTTITIKDDRDKLPAIRKWLEKNCIGGVFIDLRPTRYCFEEKSDAIKFKLAWGGE